jgi:hypothetical protein
MRHTHAFLREVLVDRIGMILKPLNRVEAGRMITALHNLHAFGRARTWQNDYQTRSDIHLTDSVSIFAEIGYTRGQTYFKIDWRPPQFGMVEWQAYIDLLANQFGITYSDLMRRGKVSYLEVAADYEGVDSGELFVYHPTLKSGRRFPTGEQIFPSLYIGHPSHSRCFFHTYSRAQRIDSLSVGSLTRIEARYRYTGLVAAALLETPLALRNEFLRLCVCDRSRARRLASAYVGLGLPFLATEERHGAQRAFLDVSPASRRLFFMRSLNSTRCDWWNPAAIWGLVPDAIRHALTPATPL